MPKPSLLVAALSATALVAVATAPVHAKPSKPRPELVTKNVTASLGSGAVTTGATVKNKGDRKAKASVATFYLSPDAKQSSDDTSIGTAPVGELKPKRSTPVAGTFAIPASAAPGSYHVVVCADSASAVKEHTETNNCTASAATITIAAVKLVTVSYSGGDSQRSVTGSATHGTCTNNPGGGSGSCLVQPGVGSVTLTATAVPPFTFAAWTGPTCDGTPNGATMTFTAPTSDKHCIPLFAAP